LSTEDNLLACTYFLEAIITCELTTVTNHINNCFCQNIKKPVKLTLELFVNPLVQIKPVLQ